MGALEVPEHRPGYGVLGGSEAELAALVGAVRPVDRLRQNGKHPFTDLVWNVGLRVAQDLDRLVDAVGIPNSAHQAPAQAVVELGDGYLRSVIRHQNRPAARAFQISQPLVHLGRNAHL